MFGVAKSEHPRLTNGEIIFEELLALGIKTYLEAALQAITDTLQYLRGCLEQ